MPVDDKPVLVSDKPVEVKPLIGERKEIAACDTPSVCVDKGVQTDDSGAVRDSMHMAMTFDDRSFVRTPLQRFVGVAVRVHKGKDGRVRQLCGPGITTLQGRPKKAHVSPQRAPSRVEKKKVVAPKSKFIWRRKEALHVVSSLAATTCDAVDITLPFRAEPHALRTTLFEGGEDDMGKTANQREDKTQGEEAVEQGQAISEKEPREDKAKKFQASGHGTTALAAVVPHHGTTGPTTVLLPW